MAIAPDVHLFGKLDNIVSEISTASTVELGSVDIALCGYGSQAPRVPSEAMLARVMQDIQSANGEEDGTFAVWLYNNTLISPDGTYYTVTIRNANGDITQVNAYRFTAPGDYDIDGLVPYDPNQPPPPLPPIITSLLLIVPWSATPEFPGDVYTTYRITLTGDVTSSTAPDTVQGNLYTFIIVQDATGGHQFTWPTNFINASPINPAPNSITVQTFVMDLSSMDAIGAATWLNQ
jgi:hypothetical protein